MHDNSGTPDKQFDFGANWKEFSANALSSERVDEAKKDFLELTSGLELRGKSFLDIGFGQGLSLLTAASLGARIVGCDINTKCAEALTANRPHFPEITKPIPTVIGSILDQGCVEQLHIAAPDGDGRYDIVHSWGVLHHTGVMKTAIANAASLIRPGGHFILALYNRHWTSPIWTLIKWLYVSNPRLLQKLFIALFVPIIFLAKLAVTRQDPRKIARGMDFYYNVIDWVGGYPYEYVSIEETKALLDAMGFDCRKAVPAEVPTGCNEFVFVKR